MAHDIDLVLSMYHFSSTQKFLLNKLLKDYYNIYNKNFVQILIKDKNINNSKKALEYLYNEIKKGTLM